MNDQRNLLLLRVVCVCGGVRTSRVSLARTGRVSTTTCSVRKSSNTSCARMRPCACAFVRCKERGVSRPLQLHRAADRSVVGTVVASSPSRLHIRRYTTLCPVQQPPHGQEEGGGVGVGDDRAAARGAVK
eukprot:g46093.t1